MSFISNIKQFFNKDEKLLLNGEISTYDVKKKKRKKVVINGEKYEMLVSYSSKLSNLNREIIFKTEKSDKINKEIDGTITEVVTIIDNENESLQDSLDNINNLVEKFKLNIDNIKNTENLTEDVYFLSKENDINIKNLSRQVQITNRAIEEISDKISILNKKIEKIDLINEAFRCVCTQVNLLTLNTTIEVNKLEGDKEGFNDIVENLKRFSKQSQLSCIEVEKYIKLINYNIKDLNHKVQAGMKEASAIYKSSQNTKYIYNKLNDKIIELNEEVNKFKVQEQEDTKILKVSTNSLANIKDKTSKSVKNVNKTLNVNEKQRKELDNIKALSHELAGINKQIENELVEIIQKKK